MRLRRSASASSGLTIDRVDSEEKLNCGSSEKRRPAGAAARCSLRRKRAEGRQEKVTERIFWKNCVCCALSASGRSSMPSTASRWEGEEKETVQRDGDDRVASEQHNDAAEIRRLSQRNWWGGEGDSYRKKRDGRKYCEESRAISRRTWTSSGTRECGCHEDQAFPSWETSTIRSLQEQLRT